MKQKLTLLLTLAFCTSLLFAQKGKKNKFVGGQKKPELFGVAFTLSDFNAPKNFGKSNATSLPISDMSAGVSLSYWKGLTPLVDFSAKLNGVFHNYAALYNNQPGRTEIGLEFEPAINIRPLKDENMWAPFLSVGWGVGVYTNRVGSYVPLGAGIQFNASSNTYFMIQAQYKASITQKVMPDCMLYSFGFAQNISLR